MPTVPLPENANLEHLKNQAKLVKNLVRSSDDGAIAMVHEFHPGLADILPDSPELQNLRLSDAQVVIARLYGFASWTRLKDHVAKRRDFSRSPDLVEAHPASPAFEFLRLCCLRYGTANPRPDIVAGRIRELAWCHKPAHSGGFGTPGRGEGARRIRSRPESV